MIANQAVKSLSLSPLSLRMTHVTSWILDDVAKVIFLQKKKNIIVKRAARQLHAPAHLRGRPFLVDFLQCDAPGVMNGVHQPDIFLEQCRCSHSVSCFGVTRNLPLRHRYTISLQNYKFHRTSPKKGKTFVLRIKGAVAVILGMVLWFIIPANVDLENRPCDS